jgi:hypothetical protein
MCRVDIAEWSPAILGLTERVGRTGPAPAFIIPRPAHTAPIIGRATGPVLVQQTRRIVQCTRRPTRLVVRDRMPRVNARTVHSTPSEQRLESSSAVQGRVVEQTAQLVTGTGTHECADTDRA